MPFVSPITEPLRSQILAMAERGVHHTALAQLVRDTTGQDYSDGSMRNWLARQARLAGPKRPRGRPRKDAAPPPLAPPQPKTSEPMVRGVRVLATSTTVAPASEIARGALLELAEISAQCRDLAARQETPQSERVPLLELATSAAVQRYTLAAEFVELEAATNGADETRH